MAREPYLTPPILVQYISLGTVPSDDTFKAVYLIKEKIPQSLENSERKNTSVKYFDNLRKKYCPTLSRLRGPSFKLSLFLRKPALCGSVNQTLYLMPSYTPFCCFIDHLTYLYQTRETVVHFRTPWRLNCDESSCMKIINCEKLNSYIAITIKKLGLSKVAMEEEFKNWAEVLEILK